MTASVCLRVTPLLITVSATFSEIQKIDLEKPSLFSFHIYVDLVLTVVWRSPAIGQGSAH